VKQEITKVMADGTATLAVSGGIATKLGWFEFLNANAPALGFMASVFFGLVATMFYWLTYKKKGTPEENTKKIQAHVAEIEELRRQIKAISDRKKPR
jgi:hypothetical protein